MVLLVAGKGRPVNTNDIFHVKGYTPFSITMFDLGFCSKIDLAPQAPTINPRA
jgi:hypothetical protein